MKLRDVPNEDISYIRRGTDMLMSLRVREDNGICSREMCYYEKDKELLMQQSGKQLELRNRSS